MASLIGTIIGYSIIPLLLIGGAISRAKKGKSYKTLYIIGIVIAVISSLGSFAQKQAGGNFGLDEILMLVVEWAIVIIGTIILFVVRNKANQGESFADSENASDSNSSDFNA